MLNTISNFFKKKFDCPICDYRGPFLEFKRPDRVVKYMRCPQCKGLVRHRLQYLVLKELFTNVDSSKRMLHVAPEPFFIPFFKERLRHETTDLFKGDVDHPNVDLTDLPFEDESFDFVYASHVLEHVVEDLTAILEVKRVLKPGGVAVLPVPIVCNKTAEYNEPNPHDHEHVRACGEDYFDRYKAIFNKVDTYTSDQYPEQYQLYYYTDFSIYPTKEIPLRPGRDGKRHCDIVPVCHKKE